ncbi:MAG: tyrosine-type recombinase/integrase [Candidatus Shapirobacteria bacterium]|nr:tyrosine-type recombinase/integrase [Candidatus Shapirobacteria bacterium]
MNNNLTSLDSSLEKFLAHLKNENRSNNTIIAYENDLNQLVDFVRQSGVGNIGQVTTNHIENFKNHLSKEKQYTDKTVSRKLNSIKSFFRFLIDSGVIGQDPADDIAHPKISQKPPRILSPLEYRALRDVCRNDNRSYAIVELMLQGGLRISEVANLEISDIQEDRIIIRPYESHEERVIPLNKAAKRAIEDYLEERPKTKKSTSLFITKNGNSLLVRNIRNSINRYFKIADIDNVYVNNLRDTFVVQQLKAGVPLNVVSKIIGHKRVSSTEKYLQLVEEKETNNIKLKEL